MSASSPLPPPEIPPRDTRILSGNHPLSGVTIVNISPAIISEMELDGEPDGVVITQAGQGRRILGVQWQRGDIINSINNQAITSTRQLQQLMQSDTRSWVIIYTRDGAAATLTVRM